MKLFGALITLILAFSISSFADVGGCPRCSQPYPRPQPGQRATLSVSDGATYNFGVVAVNGYSEKIFILTNSGAGLATDLSGGGLAAPYSFKGGSFPGRGGDCSRSLGAGSSCALVVVFAPANIANFNDTVDINYFDGETVQSASRNLTGTSAQPAVVTPENSLYEFETVVVTGNSELSIVISNVGQLPATDLSGSGISYPFVFKGGSYPGRGGTCSTSLNAGASCVMVVSFRPARAGLFTDTINMNYFDGANSQQVSLDIAGTAVTPGSLAISDGPIFDFGTIPLGYAIDGTLILTNTGGFSLNSIDGQFLRSDFEFKGGAFPGEGGTCSSTLAAASSCEVVVTFAPSARGLSATNMYLEYNDGISRQSVARQVQGYGK